MKIIKYGIDNINENLFLLKKKKIGLVCNQASVNTELKYTHLILNEICNIKYLFSPQHGFYSVEQANMIESLDQVDELTGLRVLSLYSDTRQIKERYMNEIDAIVFDLQDVGTRYYTYLWTLYYCMESCEKFDKELIILDRPNIINGVDIEGNQIDENFLSFVGLYSTLNRFGLTMGEFALYLKEKKFSNCKLEIVKLKDWDRNKYFDEFDNHWIPASPNIPGINTSVVYPGMCFFEATNISEGRGTTTPFEVFGAPFIEPLKLKNNLNQFELPGVEFRPVFFKPTFDKYAGEVCGGLFIHVINRKLFKPVKTAICIMNAIKQEYSDKFDWYRKAYEYEKEKLAIDILAGTDKLRNSIENNQIEDFLTQIEFETNRYKTEFKKWWLY
jgi:uncharacterized protein YbbC (DUF1343 family)